MPSLSVKQNLLPVKCLSCASSLQVNTPRWLSSASLLLMFAVISDAFGNDGFRRVRLQVDLSLKKLSHEICT